MGILFSCISRGEPGVGARGGGYPGLLPATDPGAFRLMAYTAAHHAGAAGA